MFKNILCLIFTLQLTQARYGIVPKFYALDSAIIVDAGKAFTQKNNAFNEFANRIRMSPPFPIWRQYPRYRIIPPPPPPPPPKNAIFPISTWLKMLNVKPFTVTSSSSVTATTTSGTTTPKPTAPSSTISSLLSTEEFPAELLDVAQNKLGLKSMDEIPSISEFGQLLGTSSSEETLRSIKQLTSNAKGVALVKAYIESADYTDNTAADLNNRNDYMENVEEKVEDNENEMVEIEDPITVKRKDLIEENANTGYELNSEKEETETSKKMEIIKKPTEMPEKNIGLLERIANYMHENNFTYISNKDEDNEDSYYPKIDRITENGKKVSNKKEEKRPKIIQENQTEYDVTKDSNDNSNLKTPILPYNYPVPFRMTTSATTTPAPHLSNTPAVHLNTPKILIPHVQQLSRITKIPSKQIEDFLAGKPKLLELANKVSRVPVSYDRNSPIEAQVLAAVQKAFEKDEDLKSLLSSTATLN